MPENSPIEPKLFGTRDQHVAATRIRALEYLPNISGALASLTSDMSKHAETHDLLTDAIEVTRRYAAGELGASFPALRKVRDYIESLS